MARFSIVLFISMVLVIVQSSSAEETCQSLGGKCIPVWSNVKCDGQSRFPMAGCMGSFCCLPPKQATCQDMGGTCKFPVSSGIRCDGLLKYATPGCAASEWCCAPDQTTTPSPRTTTKTTVKTCAASCGNCRSTKTTTFCPGSKVPASDCNAPTEFCCVQAWTGPCLSSP